MFQVLIVVALLVAVGAFAPSRFATRASSQWVKIEIDHVICSYVRATEN